MGGSMTSKPAAVREYKAGQVLFRYYVDLFTMGAAADKSDPATLERWTVVRTYSRRGCVHVVVTHPGHWRNEEFIAGGVGWLEAELATTEHAAYLDAVRRLKDTIKRLGRQLKAVEAKAKKTGRKRPAAGNDTSTAGTAQKGTAPPSAVCAAEPLDTPADKLTAGRTGSR